MIRGRDRVNMAVFNKDKGMLVEARSVPEPLCGHNRLHGYPLLQVNANWAPLVRGCDTCHRVCNMTSPLGLISFCHAKFGVDSDGWRFVDGWSADRTLRRASICPRVSS